MFQILSFEIILQIRNKKIYLFDIIEERRLVQYAFIRFFFHNSTVCSFVKDERINELPTLFNIHSK